MYCYIYVLCIKCCHTYKPDVSKYVILGISRSLILPEAAFCKEKKTIFTRHHVDVKFLGQAVRAKFTYFFFSRDIMSIYNEPPPGMCIVPDKEDITKVCMLLISAMMRCIGPYGSA